MTTTDPANTTAGAAVAAPIDRPVRPDSEAWVRQWFAEHYEAGDVFDIGPEALTLKAAVEFATAAAAAEREYIAVHFDERDRGHDGKPHGVGFYDPHEPAEIIRALGPNAKVTG